MSNAGDRGSYREVIAWQMGMELCQKIYSASSEFPDHEKFGLVAEIRKTARSIVFNIAEGHRRRSGREFARFLDIARGSQAEVDNQLRLAVELGYLDSRSFDGLSSLCDETGAVIYSLMIAVRDASHPSQ